jgi:hypothetical protein
MESNDRNLRPCFGTGRSRVRTNEGFTKAIQSQTNVSLSPALGEEKKQSWDAAIA